jgi:hypothetical protein
MAPISPAMKIVPGGGVEVPVFSKAWGQYEISIIQVIISLGKTLPGRAVQP